MNKKLQLTGCDPILCSQNAWCCQMPTAYGHVGFPTILGMFSHALLWRELPMLRATLDTLEPKKYKTEEYTPENSHGPPLKFKVWLADDFPFQAAGLVSGSFAVHFPGCTLQLARSFQHVAFEFPKSGYLQRGFPLNPPVAVISSVPVLSLLRWKMIAPKRHVYMGKFHLHFFLRLQEKRITKLINYHVLMYLSCVYRFIVALNVL